MGSSSSSEAAAAGPIDTEAAAAVAIDPEADKAAAKSCKDMHQAAKEGNVGAVRRFLRVDPESLESTDLLGQTALHPAAENGHAAVVEQLISAGATVHAANKAGWMPLHRAAVNGHAAVVEQLISAGATVDAADNNGETALHRAADGGHAAVVEQLISAGAKVDATRNDGRTALHNAAHEGHAVVVEQLISAGAQVDVASKLGLTALHWAARNGHAAVVEQLISAGAKVDATRNDGETALHRAADGGHAAVVEQLISAGAKVDATRNDGQTALHDAALHGRAAVVEQLISAGAKVDAANNDGETPLHFAAQKGHAAVVEQLISAGATVDAANNGGQTPYDWAEINGRRQVMGLLRPVFVALLSGRSCRCDSSQERTVLELKEEAEKKLGVKVKHLIGQNHEPLDESMKLAAAQIVPGNTLTAVISEDALEEGHPEAQAPAQPADPSMSEDGVEIKDFPHGIRLMAQQAIFEGFDPQIEVLENWSDLKEVSALEEALPAGHVPLARLLRLTPEDRTFPAPVKVQVPTCAGAETLWRSSTTGWEQVETATFEETRATVTVDHFCEFVVTGKPHPLKGLGFLHAQGENAQVIIMHTGCESCERNLAVLCSDPDSLQPLRRCSPNLQLGTFRNDEALEIKQPGRTSKMKIRFHRMPLMSPELDAQSRQHFNVEIEDQNHCFKIRPEEATAATAATAEPGLEPHSAGSAEASSAAMTGNMESAAAPAAPTGPAPRRPCRQRANFKAVGTYTRPVSVASTDRGHLMLSGRFNSDAIVAYMKEVKSQLETRSVPVFMVDASTGQDFGHMTCEGLYRAKGMVAFCTSEYGAYTRAGYETFYELEFAHQNQLPLFPIKLCDQWPPAPQNNERGTCQNKFVFKKSLVFAEDLQMTNAKGVADKIAESVARLGIFRN